MTLRHPNQRAAMHWLRHGEVACGRAFDRLRNRLCASTDALVATCADCWRVMVAVVAADDMVEIDDRLVDEVRLHVAAIPRSGWRASRLRKVNNRRAHGQGVRLLRDLPATEAAEPLGLLLQAMPGQPRRARTGGTAGPGRPARGGRVGARLRGAVGAASVGRGGESDSARGTGSVT
jgi:hypothetical protein